MSTAIAMERIAETPARFKARIGGVFYLLTFLTGGLAVFARGGLVVDGDAAATATSVLAHDLLVVACYVTVTALFYDLFRPVSRSVSLLAAFFSLAGCAIQGLACLFELAPLLILGGAQYLSVFKVEQLQALAFMSLKFYGQAYSIALVFFGFYCLLVGYLIFKSAFLPRFLGVLMAIAGLGWLTFLSPPLAKSLSPYILALGILGEGLLTLWLVMGVNAQRSSRAVQA